MDAYEDHDATGLAALVRAGEVTPDELLDAALTRIETRDPAINAVVHHMEDDARRRIADGLPEGPLTGVPFLLKDLLVLDAGQPCGNGSRLCQGLIADHDSWLVERYRKAGMVIIGRTNTPELGLSATTEPVAHGPTRNPWAPGLSAGGSSGGAAAAVAAGMVPAAHATDGAGSIRIPASACGLVGLKPTRGRSTYGPDVGEGWSGLATAHAVTRSVHDAALLLDVIAGPGLGDPYTAPPPERPFADEVGIDPGRLRIGFATTGPGAGAAHPDCVAAVEHAARLLADLGHEVDEHALAFDAGVLDAALRITIAGNIAHLVALLADRTGREPDKETLEPVTLRLVELGRKLGAADYARAVMALHGVGRQIAAHFERFDVLLTPTLLTPPPRLGGPGMQGEDLDDYFGALWHYIPFTPPYNVAGAPAISLPLHWNADGVPIGVQLGARQGGEGLLIRLAAQLEQATPWWHRRPPDLARA